MGHQIITCDNCGASVMEGRNDWHCDCGWYYNPLKKKPINVSPELYNEIDVDLEEYYKNNLSHWDRIWEGGKPGGYEAVIERFDLKCQVVGEYLKVSLENKESGQVVWEKGYDYSGE